MLGKIFGFLGVAVLVSVIFSMPYADAVFLLLAILVGGFVLVGVFGFFAMLVANDS